MTFELSPDILRPSARDHARRLKPRVAVVLGSGFGGVAEQVEKPFAVPYLEIPGHPKAEVPLPGHAGELLFGTVQGTPVAVFCGRVHTYQGVSAKDAAFPARLAAGLGCQSIILTNASGAVSPELSGGDIVLISDHINLTGASPLTGWTGPVGGVPFVPMRDAYDPVLRGIASEVAEETGKKLAEGVYVGLPGPAFETPAEVAYLRTIGADIVGMSTVHEVIAARALGLRVLGVSLVTNTAAGEDLSHDGVLTMAESHQPILSELLAGILGRL